MKSNNFLQELNESETKALKKAIKNFLLSRSFDSNYKVNAFKGCTTFNQIDNICGFAYTSSSSFAVMSVCNVSLYLDIKKVFRITSFCMSGTGCVYVLCSDVNDNTLTIMISNK